MTADPTLAPAAPPPRVQLHLDPGPGEQRAPRMVLALTAALAPEAVLLRDESHKHSAGPGAGTHWSVTLVSARFGGLRAVQRHQLIYGALRAELDAGLHALSIRALTPDEAAAAPDLENPTPPCFGGGG